MAECLLCESCHSEEVFTSRFIRNVANLGYISKAEIDREGVTAFVQMPRENQDVNSDQCNVKRISDSARYHNFFYAFHDVLWKMKM